MTDLDLIGPDNDPGPADPDYDFHPAWLNRFLLELRNNDGHVEKTCHAVGIRSKRLVYHWAKANPDFQAAFETERENCRLLIRHELEDEFLKLARSGDIEHVRVIITTGQGPERIKVTKRMREILLALERLDPDRWAAKPPPPVNPIDNSISWRFPMSDRELIEGQAEDADFKELPPGQETP